MPGKSHKISNGAHLDDDLLYRHLEKMTTLEEEARIEQHLDTCNNCFAELTALTEIIQTPITETEKIEIARSRKISPEKQVEKILESTNKPEPVKPPSLPPIVVIKILIAQWLKYRRYAVTFAVVMIGALVTLLPYQFFIRNNTANYYVYDEHVPYDYNLSGLRGTQSDTGTDSLLQVFVNQFKLGMADYLSRDYANAVEMFQSLEPVALSLQQTQVENEVFLAWLRNYYFYSGVSHFALSRSRASDFSPEVKQLHVTEAIRCLAQADSLVAARHFEGSDREIYFLGLAYGFGGRIDLAMAQLQKITPESGFYQNALKLIEKWAE